MERLKFILYKILDIVKRGRGMRIRVNDFTFRFPTRYYRRFPANYERSNFEFLRKNCRAGDVVIDIGAHMGLFSVCALQCTGPSGKVYSFEPTPSTFSLLEKTISINKATGQIVPVKAAVAEKKGVTMFYSDKQVGSPSNSLISYEDRGREGYEVDIVSIDGFVNENGIKVNFMKIDAEGAELSVLKGAEMTILKYRPVCILAMHPRSIVKFGDSNKKIWDFLQKLKYNVTRDGKSITETEFCEQERLFDVHLLP